MRLDDIFRAPRQSGVNVRAPRWGGGQAEAGGAPPAPREFLVIADTRTNALLVRGPKQRMDFVAEAVALLDIAD